MEEWYGFRIIRWDIYIPETRIGIISLTFQVMPGFDYGPYYITQNGMYSV